MTTYRHAQTVNLCYFKQPTGESCNGNVQWAVKTERGNMFKVCDLHLPWALHFSGLPARVNAFSPPEQEEEKVVEPEPEDEEPTTPYHKLTR